jgi:hypothetical protein
VLTTLDHAPAPEAAPTPAPAPAPTPAACPGPFWVTQAACPPTWPLQLERVNGGFFHSPPGLTAGAPAGEPLYAELRAGDATLGLATGVWSRCTFNRRPRHVHFPTTPALLDAAGERDAVLGALVEVLQGAGAAEVTFDSFDAAWRPEASAGDAETRERLEFLVPLEPDPDGLARRCHKHHRRHLQQAPGRRWSFRPLDGPTGRAVLATVQQAAAGRAAQRGDPFQVMLPPLAEGAGSADGGAHWGATTFAISEGDTVLAAALVGWARRRGYYLMGGSTPAGYAANAAVWLQWRIMCYLAEEGFSTYNLGGTPVSAAASGDPQHGLYRFKSGFGAVIAPCRSVRWVLRPAHLGVHRVARWVARRLHTEA